MGTIINKPKTFSAFQQSIIDGLSIPYTPEEGQFKKLSSRYFYDDEGSRIFKQIMDMPEYYLTDCEFEILEKQSEEIYNALEFENHFRIVELGAGDGKKTIKLLEYLVHKNISFTYVPIDISAEAIEMLKQNVVNALPEIDCKPMVGDYFQMMNQLSKENIPALFLFLGSNIGNFPKEEAHSFLNSVQKQMKKDDKLLLGVDLVKNPNTIRNAYDDAGQITRKFNLNLLKRMNRELGANFDLEFWDFYSCYYPLTGEVRSFIISLKEQEVHFESIGQTFRFENNEVIFTELSKKYSLAEIKNMGESTGLSLVQHFQDSRSFFSDTMFKK